MKINTSWRLSIYALLAWGGVLFAQTKETPESVEPPLQINSDGANRYEEAFITLRITWWSPMAGTS